MTKHLLSLASAVAISAASAFASAPLQGPVAEGGETTVNGSRAATKDGYEIKFCGDPASAYTLNENNTTYRCYIHITPDVATQLAGNKLTEISLSPAILVSNTLDGYVFVSENLDGDPVTSTDVVFTNSYNQSKRTQTFQKHALTDAYEIKENTGFYFGYVMNNVKAGSNNADYVIGVDQSAATPFAGTAEVLDNGNIIKSVNVGEEMGCNLLLKATTVGSKKALNNLIGITSAKIGNFAMPITDKLSGNTITAKLFNCGSNKVTSINYTVSVAGGESATNDRSINLMSNRSSSVTNLIVPDLVPGKGKITLTINKINGEDITPISCDLSYIGIEGEAYPRKFVVEEGTGTWCGYCPRGIVGFDYMSTNYPDEFIGIAAHSGDAMETDSYAPLFRYITGFPGAMINRDPAFIIDPAPSTLKSNYTKWQTQKGMAEVKIETCAPADGVINVTATTTFAIDDANADYSLAFVTLEDGIMGVQTNYYAGGSNGAMGGWESKGSSVRTEYKHVARNIYDYSGLRNSIPAQVTKGVPVVFNYNLSLDNVTDVEKSSIVALLLDNATGMILNAAQIHAAEYGTSGISDIITEDTEAPVEYYNLQGIRMAGDNLPAGIYVTRQGGKTGKVVVK